MLAITERCAEEPSCLVAAVAATTTTTTSKATAVAKSFLYLDVTSLAEHVVTLHFVQLPALAALAWVCIAGEGKLLSPKQLADLESLYQQDEVKASLSATIHRIYLVYIEYSSYTKYHSNFGVASFAVLPFLPRNHFPPG